MNTVGSVDITARVRLGIEGKVNPDDYEYTDEELSEFLVRAVELYSNELPFIRRTTITSVADQDMYALPSDAIHVEEVQYRAGLVDADVDNQLDADDYPNLAGIDTTGLEGLDFVRRRLRIGTHFAGEGAWEEVTNLTSYGAGRFIMLYPAPDEAGDTIRIRYSSAHPLVNANYSSIPRHHADHLARLCIAQAKEYKAAQIAVGPVDFDSGQTRFRTGLLRQDLVKEAAIERAAVLTELRTLFVQIG